MPGITVAYDSRAILINGKRTLLLSGAIHYPRSTPTMWPELLQRSREMGLNTIETYVFWNLHEAEPGIFNFSDQLDLLHFCQLAHQYGLSVILRIGPYICAETNYGGFPAWLREVPEMEMRTWNPAFQQAMERWVRMLTGYLHEMFAAQGGPIILFQLENEYNNIAAQYGKEGQRYLQWVSDLAQELRLDIPSIMCAGAASGSLETINTFYGHTLIEQQQAHHPDQPAIWTENWTGWYDVYGLPHHQRTPEDTAYGVARFVAAGGTGINYYMWHGGTNFGRSAMYLQTTSYDYHAPFNEYGFPTTKAYHLAQLHAILQKYADLLLQQEEIHAQQIGQELSVWTYTGQDQELTFLCNDAARAETISFAGQVFQIPARSVSLVSQGQELFNTALVQSASLVQQQLKPLENPLTSIQYTVEPLPEAWPETLKKHYLVGDKPVEQLSLTHDRSDYCWYTSELVIPATQAGAGVLRLTGVADLVHVYVDGRFLATSALPLKEDRGPLDGPEFTQTFSLHLPEGRHTLSLLLCAVGLIKGDWMLGGTNMVQEKKGFWGEAFWNDDALLGLWTMQPGLVGEYEQRFTYGQQTWQGEHWQGAVNQPLRWWRLTFTDLAKNNPLVADLTGMKKGMAWLNGRCIGRYWLVAGDPEKQPAWLKGVTQLTEIGQPSQRYYFLPSEWLQENNELVLFEEQGGDPSQVGLASIVHLQA